MTLRFTNYATLLVTYAVGCGVCLAQGYSSVSFVRAPHGIPTGQHALPNRGGSSVSRGSSRDSGYFLMRPR